ncbi:lysophospholipase [Marinobacter sp.]|uniref:lysophospholipase n=1 Tax=Marinobacter sp. TaxID=50741 RepID=UPI0034A1D2A3
MPEQSVSLSTPDGHQIRVHTFEPTEPDATLVIAHGMAEHSGRYTELARWLANRDIAVFIYDHRGHGSACHGEDLGHYADDQGWQKVTSDLARVIQWARERYPDTPLALLGHSMGSFIAQSYAQNHAHRQEAGIDRLILSATNRIQRAQLQASKAFIGTIAACYGKRHRSNAVAKMTFGKFNSLFRPNRTDYDWLSRDEQQVDRYATDPLCGFQCTTGLWLDFIGGMLSIDPRQWRKDLPVRLISGDCDPVGEMGKGIRQHYKNLQQAGIADVTLSLFPGGRHEMLNETNAAEVWQTLYQSLPGVSAPPENT